TRSGVHAAPELVVRRHLVDGRDDGFHVMSLRRCRTGACLLDVSGIVPGRREEGRMTRPGAKSGDGLLPDASLDFGHDGPDLALSLCRAAGALAELSPDTGVLGGHRLPFTGHALDQAMAAALEAVLEPLSGREETVSPAARAV